MSAGRILTRRLSRRRGCWGLRQGDTRLERSVIPRRPARADGAALSGGSRPLRGRGPRGRAPRVLQGAQGPASLGKGAEVPVAVCSFPARPGGARANLVDKMGGKGRGGGCCGCVTGAGASSPSENVCVCVFVFVFVRGCFGPPRVRGHANFCESPSFSKQPSLYSKPPVLASVARKLPFSRVRKLRQCDP